MVAEVRLRILFYFGWKSPESSNLLKSVGALLLLPLQLFDLVVVIEKLQGEFNPTWGDSHRIDRQRASLPIFCRV
jgi:hypothetical protein